MQHPTRRRLVRLALPAAAATLLTGTVVGLAVGAGGHVDTTQAGASVGAAAEPMTVDLDRATGAARTGTSAATEARSPYLADRVGAFSRSAKRVTLHKKPEVKHREYMTSALNLWPETQEEGEPLDVL